MKRHNKKLLALTTAALALPGMTPKSSEAQTIPDKFSASYRYTDYQEDDQSASTTSTGEAVQRYDISIHQLSFVAPVSSKVSLNLDVASESMSGASPWYVAEGAGGQPVQVMSGATIEDSRDDISLASNFYQDNIRIGLGYSKSTEDDYESTSASINTSVGLNDKNTTIDAGFSFSDDDISPTQDSIIDPTRVSSEEKDSQSFSLGVSQVVNKTLLIGAGYSYAQYKGYLSDPYKLASVQGVAIRDNRPDKKKQFSIDLKLRQYINRYDAAIHADYRFYDNSWGVSSNTVKVGWYQNIHSWQISTSLRWYDQSAANFHRNFYTETRADGYYSSDYRLSAYGALSFMLGVSKEFEFGTFKIIYEDYNSGKGQQSSGELNPGLVDFRYITFGFDYQF